MQKLKSQQGGFIQIIVIIVLVILVVSLLGVSLRELYYNLSGNPRVGENFSFVTSGISDIYNNYLARPVSAIYNFLKTNLFQR